MVKHLGRDEQWKRNNPEEYTSDFGIVKKFNNTWVSLVKEGFSYRICGKGFVRVRSAMDAAEEAAERLKLKGSPLPPIHFPAHIFN